MSLSKPAINVPTLTCEDDATPVVTPDQEPEGAAELKDWTRADRQALALIQALIAPNLCQLTAEAKTASHAFVYVNTLYQDDSLTNQIYLKKSILFFRQDDSTPCLDLTAHMLYYQNQPRLIGKPLDELDLVVVLLASLIPRFNDWIGKVEKEREEDSS